jgi:phosphatidylserine/phosphatidylglycerophosphate/cardiolipin synthase-like enzyme
MLPWPPEAKRAFAALAPHAHVAGPLCRAVAAGRFIGCTRLSDICAGAGIAEARSGAVEKVLLVGATHGMFVRYGLRDWAPADVPFSEFATALEAVALYREEVHVDTDLVQVALTPPGKTSRLTEALHARGWIEADLEHTEPLLRHLAATAVHRFVVMSPFLDGSGAAHLIDLFAATPPGVQRVLIARCGNGVPPQALQDALPALLAQGVAVHNYWLPRPGGFETFHAKVIVADDQRAYLGSANMTQASLWVSMELGAFLTGRSVKTLASVLDAILAIAPEIC